MDICVVSCLYPQLQTAIMKTIVHVCYCICTSIQTYHGYTMGGSAD